MRGDFILLYLFDCNFLQRGLIAVGFTPLPSYDGYPNQSWTLVMGMGMGTIYIFLKFFILVCIIESND